MRQSYQIPQKLWQLMKALVLCVLCQHGNTEALQLHTTLTFAGLKAHRQSIKSSRVPAWLRPQPSVFKPLYRVWKATNLRNSAEPGPHQQEGDFPLDFLEGLKEHNAHEGKRKQQNQTKAIWNTKSDESTYLGDDLNLHSDNGIDANGSREWFNTTLQGIKDRYEDIRMKLRAELAESREADPESVPANAESMVDTVIRQEMETIIKETRSSMELDRYRQLEIKELNAVENLDVTNHGEGEKVMRLIQESKEEVDRRNRLQEETDAFLKYQKATLQTAADEDANDSSTLVPVDDLNSWALGRMEDMLSNNANNSVLKSSVGDLRKRIKRAKSDTSFKPESYEDWKMYKAISRGSKNRTDAVADNDDNVLEQLSSWKAYLAAEQAYRQEAGLTTKLKMPFDWNQADFQTPPVPSSTSAEEKRRNADLYSAEINREAVKAMESLLEKRRGEAGSEELAIRIANLKATLELTNYVDRVVTEDTKASSGPVDLSAIFGSASKIQAAPKKKRVPEEFSKFPKTEKKEEFIQGNLIGELNEKQPDIVDDFVDSYESIAPEIFVEPAPPERPDSLFFKTVATDDDELSKKSSLPKTPFFEEIDRSDEKLGSLEEQKLRNMFRKAGARSDKEQDSIRKGWEEFQAYEASIRDLSGMSVNDLSSNLTDNVELGYNISDVIKKDGDIDAEKVIASLRARRPKPSGSKGRNEDFVSPKRAETEILVSSSQDISVNLISGAVENDHNAQTPDNTLFSDPILGHEPSDTGESQIPFSDSEHALKSSLSIGLDQLESSSNDDSAMVEPISGKGKFTSGKFKRPPTFERLFEEPVVNVEGSSSASLLANETISQRPAFNGLGERVDAAGVVLHAPIIDDIVETELVESANVSLEDFGMPMGPPALKDPPRIDEKQAKTGNRFSRKNFVKPQQEENDERIDLDARHPVEEPSGRALGGFLGDEAFDRAPARRRSNPDDIQHQREELERLQVQKENENRGISLVDILGRRDRDDDYKRNTVEEYFFPVRNVNADLSSYWARRAVLMDRPLLNVVDVNNLMELKDSLEGDGRSRYIPPINKPFSEFGAIVRLEGVLVDITGLQYKAWKQVAEKHNFEPPRLEDVKLATVTKPEVAVQRVFFWSNDIEICREAAVTHANAVRDIVTGVFSKSDVTGLLPLSPGKSKTGTSIGDAMLQFIGETEKKKIETRNTLTDSELQIIHHNAWIAVAAERGLTPPSFEDAVSAIVINDPAFIVREWFNWSSDDYVIQEIAQAYRTFVLKDVSKRTGARFDLPQKKQRRGFLPAMVDPSVWRQQKQESVEEVEADAKRELIVKIAKDSWFILARARGFRKPGNDSVSQAMRVGPDEAVVSVFGWAESTDEKLDIVRQYYDILNKQMEKEKLNDASKGKAKAREPDLALVQLVPDAFQWISSLVNVEMSCGLISFLERDVVDIILERTGLSSLFTADKIITASDMYARNDQLMLGAVLRLERKPDHCILFDSTPETSLEAREIGIKCIGITGIFPSYELVAADATTRDFDALTPKNIRRLFADRENQEPMLLSEVVRPIKKRLVKTRFVDENDREWDSDEYYEKYGNYGESLESEDRRQYDNLEDTFYNSEAPGGEGGIAIENDTNDGLFE